jgi:pyrroline-5-carboxylate reductase
MNVLFIGGGNMGRALVGGLLAQGCPRDAIAVVEVDAAVRARLQVEFGVHTVPEIDSDVTARAGTIVLAVKPQHLRRTAQSLAPHLAGQLVISIAAGIRLADLSRWLGGYMRLVRVMPNTPAMIRRGIAGLFAHPTVGDVERKNAEDILDAVGETMWCEREEQLDAITAVSGSGPAYVFYFLEALIEAGQDLGFSPDQARRLAYASAGGAVALAEQSAEPPAVLRAQVTSKGGTTEAAMAVLEERAVKAAFIAAIRAAEARATGLGNELGKDS